MRIWLVRIFFVFLVDYRYRKPAPSPHFYDPYIGSTATDTRRRSVWALWFIFV